MQDTTGLITRITAFLKQPWHDDMDAYDWALLVIFAVTVAFAWKQVLRQIIGSLVEEV